MTGIRLASAADAAPLAALAARTFEDAFAADNTPEDMAAYLKRTYGPSQQAAEIADSAIATLLAELEGRTVGFAQLRAGPPPPCVIGPGPVELWRFYVDRPWHGRGVAQGLMEAVMAEAVRRGAQTLWLGVWERNQRARAFYRKCGFLDVGSQPFILGGARQTDAVMAAALDTSTPECRA